MKNAPCLVRLTEVCLTDGAVENKVRGTGFSKNLFII